MDRFEVYSFSELQDINPEAFLKLRESAKDAIISSRDKEAILHLISSEVCLVLGHLGFINENPRVDTLFAVKRFEMDMRDDVIYTTRSVLGHEIQFDMNILWRVGIISNIMENPLLFPDRSACKELYQNLLVGKPGKEDCSMLRLERLMSRVTKTDGALNFTSNASYYHFYTFRNYFPTLSSQEKLIILDCVQRIYEVLLHFVETQYNLRMFSVSDEDLMSHFEGCLFLKDGKKVKVG